MAVCYAILHSNNFVLIYRYNRMFVFILKFRRKGEGKGRGKPVILGNCMAFMGIKVFVEVYFHWNHTSYQTSK